MKRSLLSVVMCIGLTITGFGQGIYPTATAYAGEHLTYHRQRIAADRPFQSAIVVVKDGRHTIRLPKSSVYGYRDHQGRDFRFVDNNSYRILYRSPFMIYSREQYLVKGKEKTRQTKYYFSVGADAALQELTMQQLKQSWPQANDFHDQLDLHFRTDVSLLYYDSFRKDLLLFSIFRKSVLRQPG